MLTVAHPLSLGRVGATDAEKLARADDVTGVADARIGWGVRRPKPPKSRKGQNEELVELYSCGTMFVVPTAVNKA